MAKNIVFCADGTWNGPDQDENDDRQPDPTNVYKLFSGLAGKLSPGFDPRGDEQEKSLAEDDGVVQVAKYIHGVGESGGLITKLMGGAFGAGMISRVVRGYTFVSRHYEAGDSIVLAGFSRGAYTVRALAGLILSQGLLAKPLTTDKTQAYRCGAQAWYRYRARSSGGGLPQRLVEATADLPAFLSRDTLGRDDLAQIEGIKAVAVWDTVGALGVPDYYRDRRIDAYKFANTRLSPKVDRGLHAVALDERRVDFTPTLWDRADNVVQVAFAGAHADVGGGYPTAGHESDLSDIALQWMAEQLTDLGVRLNDPVYQPFSPSPLGIAHQPWTHPPFDAPGMKRAARALRGKAIVAHPSVTERMHAGAVVGEPGTAPEAYSPENLP